MRNLPGLQPDGRIVVAGARRWPRRLALARYIRMALSIPPLARRQGHDGLGAALRRLPWPSNRRQVVVTVGALASGRGTRSVLVRYTPGGSLDVTFGAGGKVDADFASALALQPDGKIVAAGGSASRVRDFAVARYAGDLPTTFIATNQLAYHQGDLMTVAVTTDPGLSPDRWYVSSRSDPTTRRRSLFVYRFDPVVELIRSGGEHPSLCRPRRRP